MLTVPVAFCLVVGLGLGLHLMSGWLVVMHTYLYYSPLSLYCTRLDRRHSVGGDGGRAAGEGTCSARLYGVDGERRRRQSVRICPARLLQQVGRHGRRAIVLRVPPSQRLVRSSSSVHR